MTRFALLFSAVLAITCHMCEGFASSGTAFLLTRNRSVVILNGLAQPEVQIKTKTKQETKTRQKVNQKEAVKTGDPISRRDEEFEEPPMFKLLLLGDEGYDKEHVILRLCAIMEDMDEDQANEVFKQAQMAGKAMAGIFPFEKAELIKEQLLRSDPMIFADMAEDKN